MVHLKNFWRLSCVHRSHRRGEPWEGPLCTKALGQQEAMSCPRRQRPLKEQHLSIQWQSAEHGNGSLHDTLFPVTSKPPFSFILKWGFIVVIVSYKWTMLLLNRPVQ